jgi:hypothetical protein
MVICHILIAKQAIDSLYLPERSLVGTLPLRFVVSALMRYTSVPGASTMTTYQKLVTARLTNDFRAATEIVTVDLPEPTPDQILVQTVFAGVNASDVAASAGAYQPGVPPPLDLGLESVGEIVAVGDDVRDLAVGDAVVVRGGAYAAYVVSKARHVVKVPEPKPEYMSLVLSGLTAAFGLYITGEMKSDETVMVTAAAGVPVNLPCNWQNWRAIS